MYIVGAAALHLTTLESLVTNTIVIIAESTAAEGKAEQVRALIESVVEPTRAEEGCLRYELFQDLNDINHVILVEEWQDQSSLDKHLGSEHLTGLFREIGPLLIDEGRGTRMTRIV
jgi:quinol monooxygenase YgiN